MATLEHLDTGEPFVPSTRVVVGRSPGCGLVLWDAGVSGEQTLVHWDGAQWVARDLGSRNGTFVDDRRLEAGAEAPLALGSIVCFGAPTQRWAVLDLDPPAAVPTTSTPLPPTRDITLRASIETIGLQIRASADQEYVEIDLIAGRTTERLAPRAWHDLYLTLARIRLEQRGAVTDAEEGWVYFDELCAMLARPRERVNVEVYRARHQLAELGIDEAVRVFERRPTTRQIRLGVRRLQVGAL